MINSKNLILILALTAVCSCASMRGNPNAPKALDDACRILDQRPNFFPAFKRVEQKYGVPVPVLMAMMWQESHFKATIRPPHQYKLGVIPVGRQSSAYGYAQVLNGTWKEYQQLTGRHSDRRDNIYDAAEFMGWYMKQSNEELGLAMHDIRNQYLAYHDGRTGYRRGTWKAKAWLIKVTQRLQNRAIMYQLQLQNCGRS